MPVPCSDQQRLSPAVTRLYSNELLTKRRSVFVRQGQVGDVELPLLNASGNAVDLTSCGIEDDNDESVTVRIREVIKIRNTDIKHAVATVVTADEGIIQFTLPDGLTDNSGVYHMEVAVNVDNGIAFTNQFYLWVDRGLFGDPQYPNAGPPNLDEIRMFLRDNAPEENRLLDDFEFDLSEICHATELAVRVWNESQPPINVFFNTNTYCVRHLWMKFIAGHMLVTAAHRFRRNHLPYQAGGLSIDDQNKFQMYDQAGMMLMQEYKDWVKQKKVQINCMAAMTSMGSGYGASVYFVMNSGV